MRRRNVLGAFTSNADLDKFKYRITKKQDGHVLRVYDGKLLIGAVGAITRNCDLPGFESHGDVISGNIIEGYRGRKLYQEMLLRLRAHLKKMGCKGVKSHGYQRSKMADRAWRKLNPRVVADKHRPTEPGYDVLFLDGLGSARDGRKGVEIIDAALERIADGEKRIFTLPPSLARESDAVILRYLLEQSQEAGKRVRSKAHFEATGTLEGLPKKGRVSLDVARRAFKRLPAKTRACGFTVAQLREGMEIEREHRDVTKGGSLATAKIAAAHLCEFPRGGYYPGLKRLERKLKGRK